MASAALWQTSSLSAPAASRWDPAERVLRLLARSSRTAVRWAVRHGLPAGYLSRSARRGDPVGRLVRDRALRERPHEINAQVRARGLLSCSSLGLVTTSPSCAPPDDQVS